jgi:hypothetical protein
MMGSDPIALALQNLDVSHPSPVIKKCILVHAGISRFSAFFLSLHMLLLFIMYFRHIFEYTK